MTEGDRAQAGVDLTSLIVLQGSQAPMWLYVLFLLGYMGFQVDFAFNSAFISWSSWISNQKASLTVVPGSRKMESGLGCYQTELDLAGGQTLGRPVW